MNLRLVAIIFLALYTCSCSKRDPGYDFKSSAIALREAQGYWLSHDRPPGFQPSSVAGTPDEFFVYTNIVKNTNGVLHCRFGARRPGWPLGVLAITDEGPLIFIRERDSAVIVAPEENGVEY